MRIGLLLLFIYLLFPHQTYASKRVALVIGNSDYKASPLKNPVNDAKDMAAALKQIGFEVILKTNVSKRQFEDAMNSFYRKLQRGEVGFFFYAGHGMQIDGMNYLIPINANVGNANDVKYEAVPAGRILGKMEDAGNKLNIVVLDACRNNPFRSYFRSNSQGLALMDAPNGTIIAYATSPGSLAADGSGRNGLYTGKLLVNLKKSDLDVLQVFNQTGLDVRKTTDGKQTPWMTSSPMNAYYLSATSSLKAKVVQISSAKQNKNVANTVREEIDLTYWNSIKDSTNEELFRAYLDEFPNGHFAKLAQLKITQYTTKLIHRKNVPRKSKKTTAKQSKTYSNSAVRVALFPITSTSALNILTPSTTSALEEIFTKYGNRFVLSYSPYDLGHRFDKQPLNLQPFDYFSYNEPNVEEIITHTTHLPVDVILLYNFRDRSRTHFAYDIYMNASVYLIDIKSRQVYSSNGSIESIGNDDGEWDIQYVTESVFKKFLSQNTLPAKKK